MSIKVLVADDHEVVRSGLASLLKDTDIKIIAEAADGNQAVEQTLKHQPDVVLMDIRMPDADGLSALEQIPLTNRELQVLRHVALGLSNREIGHSLNISIETVKEHVQNILRKISVVDRTQAAVWAVRKNLV